MKLTTFPSLLSSLSSEFSAYIPDLMFRLLRHRLLEGHTAGWDVIDGEMLDAFQSKSFTPAAKADLMEILVISGNEAWGESGADLRVRPTHFRLRNPR